MRHPRDLRRPILSGSNPKTRNIPQAASLQRGPHWELGNAERLPYRHSMSGQAIAEDSCCGMSYVVPRQSTLCVRHIRIAFSRT